MIKDPKEVIRYKVVRDLIFQYGAAYIKATESDNDDEEVAIVESAHDTLLMLEEALLDPDIDKNEELYYSTNLVEVVDFGDEEDEPTVPKYEQEGDSNSFDVV